MKVLLIFFLFICVWTIGIPLHEGPRCMIIQGEFDVLFNIYTANKTLT